MRSLWEFLMNGSCPFKGLFLIHRTLRKKNDDCLLLPSWPPASEIYPAPPGLVTWGSGRNIYIKNYKYHLSIIKKSLVLPCIAQFQCKCFPSLHFVGSDDRCVSMTWSCVTQKTIALSLLTALALQRSALLALVPWLQAIDANFLDSLRDLSGELSLGLQEALPCRHKMCISCSYIVQWFSEIELTAQASPAMARNLWIWTWVFQNIFWSDSNG